MNIIKEKIENYIDTLSSSASMPGGGSVSALAGAEGVSLILMVCYLTKGKEKYKKYEKLINETIKECEKIKKKFLYLMEKDIKDFRNIEKVFTMPKGTDKEKTKRKEAMEKACKKCCIVPKEIITYSLKGIECAKKILGKSNISAASDLGIAAENLNVAAKGAWLNILINLNSITDERLKKEYIKIKENELIMIEKISKEVYKKCVKK